MSTEQSVIHLPQWSEIIGTFGGCFTDTHSIRLKINGKLLTFLKESKEAEIVSKALGQCASGTKIGVLKTDLSDRPLRIRLID